MAGIRPACERTRKARRSSAPLPVPLHSTISSSSGKTQGASIISESDIRNAPAICNGQRSISSADRQSTTTTSSFPSLPTSSQAGMTASIRRPPTPPLEATHQGGALLQTYVESEHAEPRGGGLEGGRPHSRRWTVTLTRPDALHISAGPKFG